MKPNMMKNLLKKLVDDLPTLEEYTIVPLKMLTLWYERNNRYYGFQASEDEKRLTMTLFTRIFDSLAKRVFALFNYFTTNKINLLIKKYNLSRMIQNCSVKLCRVYQLSAVLYRLIIRTRNTLMSNSNSIIVIMLTTNI